MSSVKLSQREQIDVQAQAKILVTVAVVANLLLALVLSLILLFKPTDANASIDTPDHRNIGYLSSSFSESEVATLKLPAPADW